MRVTMMDVAKEAGVSKSTVSLVINGSNDIKLETQYRVRQAVEKLGYVPNVAARGLTTNQTQTLGVVFLTSNIQKRPYDFDSTPVMGFIQVCVIVAMHSLQNVFLSQIALANSRPLSRMVV